MGQSQQPEGAVISFPLRGPQRTESPRDSIPGAAQPRPRDPKRRRRDARGGRWKQCGAAGGAGLRLRCRNRYPPDAPFSLEFSTVVLGSGSRDHVILRIAFVAQKPRDRVCSRATYQFVQQRVNSFKTRSPELRTGGPRRFWISRTGTGRFWPRQHCTRTTPGNHRREP